MQTSRLGVGALVTGSVLTMLVFLFHPSHVSERDMLGTFSLSQIIHGTAIVASPVLLFGMWVMTRWIERPLAQLGLAFAGIAQVLSVNAAVISSFVAPAAARASGLAHLIVHAPGPAQSGAPRNPHLMDISQMPPLMQVAMAMNRGLAQAHVALLSGAFLLFGLALWNRWRALALAGIVVGAVPLGWQLSGLFSPETATMPFVVFPQAAWLIAVSIVMTRPPALKGTEA